MDATPYTNFKNFPPSIGLVLFSSVTITQAAEPINFELDIKDQTEFTNFAKDISEIFSFKTVTTFKKLDTNRFNLNFERTQSSRSAHQKIDLNSINLNAGINKQLNFGVHYQTAENTDISKFTGRVEYDFANHRPSAANISIGGHYSTVNGLKTLEVDAFGIDLGISKTFLNLTPFANVGLTNTYVNSTLDLELSEEKTSLFQYSAGMNINLFEDFDVTFGYNQTGEQDSYSIQAGYRF